MEMKWKKVSTGFDDDEIFKFEKSGDRVEGEYRGFKMVSLPGKIPFKSYLVQPEGPEGTKMLSFGSFKQINKAFENLAEGSFVRVTFNRKVFPPKGNPYKDFSIEVADKVEPDHG